MVQAAVWAKLKRAKMAKIIKNGKLFFFTKFLLRRGFFSYWRRTGCCRISDEMRSSKSRSAWTSGKFCAPGWRSRRRSICSVLECPESSWRSDLGQNTKWNNLKTWILDPGSRSWRRWSKQRPFQPRYLFSRKGLRRQKECRMCELPRVLK